MFRFDRRLLLNFDWGVLASVIIIAAMGLVNLYSATYSPQVGASHYFMKQLIYFLFGFGLILFIVSIDYRVLLTINYPIYAGTIILLLWALFFGESVVNTQRWIEIGPIRLQPSELAKLALVINLASYYYRKDTGKGFTLTELAIPIVLTSIPFILIFKQPDLGTALMLGAIFVSMTLFVRLKWRTLVILGSVVLSMIPFSWLYLLKPYQKTANPDPVQS